MSQFSQNPVRAERTERYSWGNFHTNVSRIFCPAKVCTGTPNGPEYRMTLKVGNFGLA